MKNNFATNAYKVFLLWGILSTMGTAISTFVDATLIGNYIGSDGLAVTNIATPVFLLFSMFGITLAVGANVLIGKALGQSNVEKANRLFNNGILAGLALSLLCTLAGVLFSDQILYFLGATDEIIGLARAYTDVVFWCAGLFIFYHVLSYSVRSDGDPKIAAAAAAVLIVLNIVLDFLLLGVFHMGIASASVALCIATFCADLVLLTHFFKKHSLLRFHRCKPQLSLMANYVKNGFGTGSAFLFQAIIIGVFNKLLMSSGAQGTFNVAFYSILYTMSTFAYAIFDGAATTLTPVVSIFSGEKDAPSILKVFRLALKVAIVSSIVVCLLYVSFSSQIVRFFGITDPDQLETAAFALRLFSVSFLFSSVNSIATSYWQSISKARLAGVMSVLRNFVLMLLFGMLLIPRFHTLGVSIAYICCEALCTLFVIGVMLFGNIERKLVQEYALVNRVFEREYIISHDSISQISADLERISDEWEIDMRHAFFINLMVEELILNIIKFALDDKAHSHYVAIKLLDNQGEYIMRIRDDVSDYNPFDSKGDVVDNAVIRMIKEKSKYYNYQRKLIFNYLFLVL